MKLTKEQIKEIKRLYKEGEFNTYQLAEKFNVSQPTIHYWVKSRKQAIKRNVENMKNKSPEERRRIFATQREYQREYHRKRYQEDQFFREKQKERSRKSKGTIKAFN